MSLPEITFGQTAGGKGATFVTKDDGQQVIIEIGTARVYKAPVRGVKAKDSKDRRPAPAKCQVVLDLDEKVNKDAVDWATSEVKPAQEAFVAAHNKAHTVYAAPNSRGCLNITIRDVTKDKSGKITSGCLLHKQFPDGKLELVQKDQLLADEIIEFTGGKLRGSVYEMTTEEGAEITGTTWEGINLVYRVVDEMATLQEAQTETTISAREMDPREFCKPKSKRARVGDNE